MARVRQWLAMVDVVRLPFNLRDFAGVEQFGLKAITPAQFLTLSGGSV